MSNETKLRFIRRTIKVSIACVFVIALIFFGFFVKHSYTFENSNMKKWLVLSEQQREKTLYRVIQNPENEDLLIQCVTKIANLPDSEKMDIRDGIVLCYNGIKISTKDAEQ